MELEQQAKRRNSQTDQDQLMPEVPFVLRQFVAGFVAVFRIRITVSGSIYLAESRSRYFAESESGYFPGSGSIYLFF
jgi:hypothetical protein